MLTNGCFRIGTTFDWYVDQFSPLSDEIDKEIKKSGRSNLVIGNTNLLQLICEIKIICPIIVKITYESRQLHIIVIQR